MRVCTNASVCFIWSRLCSTAAGRSAAAVCAGRVAVETRPALVLWLFSADDIKTTWFSCLMGHLAKFPDTLIVVTNRAALVLQNWLRLSHQSAERREEKQSLSRQGVGECSWALSLWEISPPPTLDLCRTNKLTVNGGQIVENSPSSSDWTFELFVYRCFSSQKALSHKKALVNSVQFIS